MDIIICGAGEIGSHAAETLAAAGHDITVIDIDESRLRNIEESMDVATIEGNCAEAEVLRDAGAADTGLLLATTDRDEVNLLTVWIAKGVGVPRTIARVHHSTFFEQRGLDYRQHLAVDRLICPEYSTALAIARKLRNPGAVALESFTGGQIEMQEFTAGSGGSAVGKRLMDVRLPPNSRLALIRRKHEAFIPGATSGVVPGDSIILAGNAGDFEDARKLFQKDREPRRRIVIMGSPPMAVWLCRALRERSFSIRLFERERERARELAEKLDWVTVIQADPTDRAVFAEERLSQADVFIPLLETDEANIIAGVLAKTRGVEQIITVVLQAKYLDVVYDIGVDLAFSTRLVAAEEIDNVLDESPLRHLGSLAEGAVDVFRVRVGDNASVLGRPLRDVKLSPDWVVAAISRNGQAHVPGADDVLQRDDVVLVIGRHGRSDVLKKLLAAK